jgi:alpha-tubulin suppressor-like RCC1 family protein
MGRARQRRIGEHNACRFRDEKAAATGDADADTRGREVRRHRCFSEGRTRVGARAGNQHSLALLKDGSVRAWGHNRYGQIGDGTSINRNTPTLVPGVRNVVAIAAGAYRSVAVLADGTVMEWGANHVNLTPRLTPAVLAGARGIKSVVAGNEHVAAITETGQIMTWGLDSHDQTGRGSNATAPGLVRGVTGVSSVAAGAETTIAVLGSGQVMTWGEVPPAGSNRGMSQFPTALVLDGLDAAAVR